MIKWFKNWIKTDGFWSVISQILITVGFFGSILTQIVFLVLKIGKIGVLATWSWWWVMSPVLILGGVVFITLFIFGMLALRALSGNIFNP